ncbi:hypothetical protein K438DRAFT_1866952 [Mycena galopus ATCC 62051]|nr:hypothetical protein K438DRAFT_1866952 [Mycena galopus ATCC 62051]
MMSPTRHWKLHASDPDLLRRKCQPCRTPQAVITVPPSQCRSVTTNPSAYATFCRKPSS